MNADSYLRSLIDIVGKTEITDKEGKLIEFNDGINKIIHLVLSQNKGGKKIIFIGNGGSAAIASHETIDFWKNGGMRAICFMESKK
ncbi:MAG: hypothetical protein N3I35_07410 [Clostridia bacterium]|nr:hypothetical protein [Clostridia bacterium]